MFTGIIQGIGIIEAIEDHGALRAFGIELPDGFSADIEIGASVSVDGVCLTTTAIHSPLLVDFDVVLQNLRVTTLADVAVGDEINVERAAKDGAEIGGHPLSGHVDFTDTIQQTASSAHNKMVRIGVPTDFRRYIFAKGYIAINGCSFTVAEMSRGKGWFEIWLIPEARRAPTFDSKAVKTLKSIEAPKWSSRVRQIFV